MARAGVVGGQATQGSLPHSGPPGERGSGAKGRRAPGRETRTRRAPRARLTPSARSGPLPPGPGSTRGRPVHTVVHPPTSTSTRVSRVGSADQKKTLNRTSVAVTRPPNYVLRLPKNVSCLTTCPPAPPPPVTNAPP